MAHHLQSLVKVIELILCHDKHKVFDNNTTPQVESLLEKACILRDSFENHPILSKLDSFEDRIRDAAQNAEDTLETYVALFPSEEAIRTLNLQKLHESFDSMKEEMVKILDGEPLSGHRALQAVASSRIYQYPKNIVVGFTNDILQLKGRVFGESSKLEIIPIVGMGGIGKTTLARSIHDDLSVVSHFDVRAWTSVSNEYILRDILLDLLGSMPGWRRDEMIGEEVDKLGVSLYKSLVGRRYLIVLDDIWRSKAWDDVKKFFPNDNNGSRIILTTRESNVATYVDSKSLHHQVRALSKVDSWELLRRKVFGEETCLPELEEPGIKVASGCGGLPLAIQVIGGILSQTERTKDSWEKVADDVISSITANKDEQISSILSLSYNNLPYYLKPCFLYMSAFREDYSIKALRLIRLWVAEGFLKPIQGKSPEEAAEEHLNALIDRNLISVRQRKSTGKVKFLGLHDLLRDLCVVKAREKKFFHVINGRTDHNISQDMLCLRRMSFHKRSRIGDIFRSTRQKLLPRSLLNLSGKLLEILPRDSSTLQLLRVLEMGVNPFPKALLRLFNLRFLACTCVDDINPGITAFRNLQILIIRGRDELDQLNVPQELFEMPLLREIVSQRMVMRCDFKESKSLVLQENLHYVSKLFVSANLYLFLAKRPNLKKLGLNYRDGSHPTVVDKSCLQKLEILSFHGGHWLGHPPVAELRGADFLSDFSFPVTLKSVCLELCEVPEECMTTLGMLPNLEILKMTVITFRSFELEHTDNWKLSPGGKFCRLKYLRLSGVFTVDWEGDETHFPVLQHLEILWCTELNKLPLGIGEIPTLKTITVYNSSPAATAWARQIQDEQLELGNDLLHVSVQHLWS